MRITSKAEFFALWEAGALGNRNALFHNAKDAWRSGYPLLGFRELRRGGAGAGKWQRVTRDAVYATAAQWDEEGRRYLIDSGTYPCTDTNITLQGEVCRTVRGWEGYMGLCPGYAMRPAMAAGLMKPYQGPAVLALLTRWMDPSSMEDVRELLDMYPDATIEFTCFDRDTGVIPGRNTLIWEVRDY